MLRNAHVTDYQLVGFFFSCNILIKLDLAVIGSKIIRYVFPSQK